MRATLTLAWKDFKVIVTSPMFYFLAFLSTLMWSYSYIRNILMFAEQSVRAGMMQQGVDAGMNIHRTVFLFHISQLNLLFIFIIPALTMRLIAEEKKLRTYDLLLTSPITATGIALGKFLAAFGAAAVLVFISALYPVGSAMFADFHWPTLLVSYLGVLLVSGCYVAVGLFASSLTESVVLSVVMGLIFNLTLWFLSQGSEMATTSWIVGTLEHVSIGQHFMGFISGSIKLSSVIFFLSCIGLFVFLAQRVIESSRWR